MTTSTVTQIAVVSAITGNRATMTGQTVGSTGLGTLTIAAISAKPCDLKVVGDIHGLLRFPFADPETFDGVLMPSELRTAQVKLTQGGAGAALALIAEEVYAY